MIQMTTIPGVPDRESIKEGMAHFSNTGPFETTCGTCAHRGYYRDAAPKFNKEKDRWEDKQRKTNACVMFRKLTGKHGPIVDADWASCKYYEPKS